MSRPALLLVGLLLALSAVRAARERATPVPTIEAVATAFPKTMSKTHTHSNKAAKSASACYRCPCTYVSTPGLHHRCMHCEDRAQAFCRGSAGGGSSSQHLRCCSTAADAGQSALLCAHPKPAALHDLGAVPQLDQFSVRTVHQVPYKDLHWGVVPKLHP